MSGSPSEGARAAEGLVEPRLGASFLAIARGPLVLASKRFSQSLLATALAELAPERLSAGLDAASDQVARRAAVPRAAVEGLLPLKEMREALGALGTTQPTALKAIGRYEATIVRLGSRQNAAGAPTPSAVLSQLAELFARDKHIASPLRKLAADISRWEELVEEGGRRLDEDHALLGLYRRRLLRLAALSCALLTLAAGVPIYLGWTRHLENVRRAQQEAARAEVERANADARIRVESFLTVADVCAGDPPAAPDLERATDEQRRRLGDRDARCADRKQKEAALARCAALLSHLDEGRLSPGDEAGAGKAGPLVGRIARHALLPTDLLATDADMPCQDAPGAPRYWEAFARAAAVTPQLWGAATGVSDRVSGILSQPRFVFSDAALRSMSFRAEDLAKRALRSGQPEALRSAKAYCALKSAVGLKLGLPCMGAQRKA